MMLCVFRPAAALAWIAFALSNENAVVVARTWGDLCKHGPPADAPCVRVGSWDDFRMVVNTAPDQSEIKFCPFLLLRNESSLSAQPNSKASFACTIVGACSIRGPGQHISIDSATAETTWHGFVFQNATDSSIRVRGNSTLEQKLCRCYFERNKALLDDRGGAVRTAQGTSVTLSDAHFRKNQAILGGAIYSRGSMGIYKSSFALNTAHEGGAIAITSSSILLVQNTNFFTNNATVGDAIYDEALTRDGPISEFYMDNGGNAAVGAQCDGLYLNANKTCLVFTSATLEPTPSPTLVPSDMPSNHPSAEPTMKPSASSAPTTTPFPTAPSPSPSSSPSKMPVSTSPTSVPSVQPSPEPTPLASAAPTSPVTYTSPPDPDNELLPLVSRNQPRGYYNFNVLDKDFGPSAWGKIDVRNNPYMMYMGSGWDVSENQCDQSRFASPIDLFETNARCLEIHQIRSRGGNWKNLTRTGRVRFEVTPTRLRLQIFANDTDIAPTLDGARGFDNLPASHVEIAIPSLHTFHGRRFDAEYSIFVVYPRKKEVFIVSVVIDASANVFNYEFQKMINAWSRVEECGQGRGRILLEEDLEPDAEEGEQQRQPIDNFNRVLPEEEERRLLDAARIDGKFNLFDVTLVPSLYFYGYSGSLVVPPCTNTAAWRVLDTPMQISHVQLQMLKDIFEQGPCKDDPMKVGIGDVVARPIQRPRGRPVWHCTRANYLSDCERTGHLCPAPGFPGNAITP